VISWRKVACLLAELLDLGLGVGQLTGGVLETVAGALGLGLHCFGLTVGSAELFAQFGGCASQLVSLLTYPLPLGFGGFQLSQRLFSGSLGGRGPLVRLPGGASGLQRLPQRRVALGLGGVNVRAGLPMAAATSTAAASRSVAVRTASVIRSASAAMRCS
jgi:hypothetical protein